MDLDAVETLTSKERSYLRKAGYTTAHEVLVSPPGALLRRLNLPPPETDGLVRKVAATCMPVCTTVADALVSQPPARLSVGAGEAFDRLFGGAGRGGLRTRSLTEIVGESATGKSNLCMQLALMAQLPLDLGGLAASALYLTSETSQSAFPSNRLHELARALWAKHADRDHVVPAVPALLDNVHLGNAAALEPLDLIVTHHAPQLARELRAKGRPRLGLVIIDSLAAPTRSDFATTTLSGLTDRAKALAVLGDKLKQLAYELDLAVVVVNQVSDVFHDDWSLPSTPGEGGGGTTVMSAHDDELHLSYDSQARFFTGQAPGLGKQAALGLVWANAIDTRIMLSRSRTARRRAVGDDDGGGAHLSIRRATLVFSPFAAPSSVDYVIERAGVRAITDRYHVDQRWPTEVARRQTRRADGESSDDDDDRLWTDLRLTSDAEDRLRVP